MATADSSHLSTITSGAPTFGPSQMETDIKRAADKVTGWMEYLPVGYAGAELETGRALDGSTNSSISIEFHDGWSGLFAWQWGTELQAKKSRAWKKELARRDRRQFSRRKRWKTLSSCSNSSRSSSHRVSKPYPPTPTPRYHLARAWRGKWPQEGPPIPPSKSRYSFGSGMSE